MNVKYIDVDFLISLVQKRRIIWDKKHKHYNNKSRTSNEWVEICKILFGDYDQFDDIKKNRIGKEVMKKWRSVRDNFFRYVKKQKEISLSGSPATVKKYHFYNQLLFLLKNAQNKSDKSFDQETECNENTLLTSSPLRTNEMPLLTPGSSCYVPINHKKSNHATDDFETQSLELLEETENRHLSFFKGILPSINDFTELQTLTFQSKVINIITEMRLREQEQSTSE